eukprot:16435387-Heterocapsa_arctica.AAC.1
MQKLKNLEYCLQGIKGQDEALKSVKAEIKSLQKQAFSSTDKSREEQAQSLLARKLNKFKKRQEVKVKLVMCQAQVADAEMAEAEK